MAITRLDPNTVFLGGTRVQIGDLAMSEVVTPGMLVEKFISGSTIRWRKATTDIAGPAALATEQAMANQGVDVDYGVGDLAEVSILNAGAKGWAFIASGQNVTAGTLLGSAGGGTLKTGATVARFIADESKLAANTGLTRIRVTAI